MKGNSKDKGTNRLQVALRLHRDTETPHQGLRVSVQNVINTSRTEEIKAITVKEQRRKKKKKTPHTSKAVLLFFKQEKEETASWTKLKSNHN